MRATVQRILAPPGVEGEASLGGGLSNGRSRSGHAASAP